MWKLILPVAALSIYFGKQKLNQLFQGLSFEPTDLEFTKNSLGLVSTRFQLGLKIYNKSDVSVPVKSVAGNVYLDKLQLAAFNIQKQFSIPANGSQVLRVDITADNMETLKSLVKVVISGTVPQIRITGGAYTALGTAPINVQYNKFPLFKTA